MLSIKNRRNRANDILLVIEHKDVHGFIAPIATAVSKLPLWLRPAVWLWKLRCRTYSEDIVNIIGVDPERKRYAVTTTLGVLSRILGLGGRFSDRAAIDIALVPDDNDAAVPGV